MNTYIVPEITELDPPFDTERRTPLVESNISWVGRPLGDGTYMIRTPHIMEDLPPGHERGERTRLNAQQMRSKAQAHGLDADDIEKSWFVSN